MHYEKWMWWPGSNAHWWDSNLCIRKMSCLYWNYSLITTPTLSCQIICEMKSRVPVKVSTLHLEKTVGLREDRNQHLQEVPYFELLKLARVAFRIKNLHRFVLLIDPRAQASYVFASNRAMWYLQFCCRRDWQCIHDHRHDFRLMRALKSLG